MNATGDRKFSTSTQEVVQPKSMLIPAGTYTLVLNGDAEIRTAEKPNAIPYVNVSFTVQGTATREGGKDLRVFHRFVLGLEPSKKDGVLNPNRSNGITAAAIGLGSDADLTIVERTVQDETGAELKQEYLNPKDVKEYLQSLQGSTVKARIRVSKSEGYADKNEIAAFFKAE